MLLQSCSQYCRTVRVIMVGLEHVAIEKREIRDKCVLVMACSLTDILWK